MNENKQTVLTDEERADIHAGMQSYAACNINVFDFVAKAIESAVLSKLRAAGEPPVGYVHLVPDAHSGSYDVRFWKPVPIGTKLYAAPQASADPTRAMLEGKPLDSEFSKVLADNFDELCIRPAAEDSAKGADVALPPLPNMDIPSDSVLSPFGGCVGYSAKAMVDYAQSAVIASRNQANGGLREAVAKWIKLKDSYCHVHDYPDMLNAEQKVRRILSGSADRQQLAGAAIKGTRRPGQQRQGEGGE